MNGATHKTIGAAVGIAAITIDTNPKKQSIIHNPLFATPIATFGGMLPDIIEPSSRGPHHRQFFHSLVVAGFLGYGLYKTYKWEPESKSAKCLRIIALLIGAGYISHLLADSLTPRGLPIV